MEDKSIKEAISKLKESPKRNFKQTIDLVINLKGLDLKKPEHQIELFLQMPKFKGKKSKICALVGPEMAESAKSVDHYILLPDFDKLDKKTIKKLAREYDFFVGQATIMPKIAAVFGRVLGPKGKMPNPKAGCVVPPNANLKAVYDKLQGTVKLSCKKAPLMQTIVGNEDSNEADLIENIKYIYNNVIHALPQAEHNIKSVFIKYTMGNPIKISK
ncbi:MAG: 50S ribosomal protein L1 [Candidatus Woesearchaeota archaeon]